MDCMVKHSRPLPPKHAGVAACDQHGLSGHRVRHATASIERPLAIASILAVPTCERGALTAAHAILRIASDGVTARADQMLMLIGIRLGLRNSYLAGRSSLARSICVSSSLV